MKITPIFSLFFRNFNKAIPTIPFNKVFDLAKIFARSKQQFSSNDDDDEVLKICCKLVTHYEVKFSNQKTIIYHYINIGPY